MNTLTNGPGGNFASADSCSSRVTMRPPLYLVPEPIRANADPSGRHARYHPKQYRRPLHRDLVDAGMIKRCVTVGEDVAERHDNVPIRNAREEFGIQAAQLPERSTEPKNARRRTPNFPHSASIAPR